MNRIIFCKFLKKEAEGQEYQIYPGTLGKRIYNEISKLAWEIWMSKQTTIINERKLNMLNLKDRKIIEKHMENFLFKNK
ncbi:oxidative damage protection protein [Buchnera aphidicola (Pemphigus obesinymphae)]|uniref:oxidative damage protection protein n=1 Tax=Buchnera aphidicola TaxID=9 RepID=UPI00223834E5|nr:oxidative damage protection protein [Buchnera aphidicola]MCW5196450.1 oxidative damage protection protein [Buchnera aphidicola (Pemphigus obesinymphae)]